jgi:hypothetical protein
MGIEEGGVVGTMGLKSAMGTNGSKSDVITVKGKLLGD